MGLIGLLFGQNIRKNQKEIINRLSNEMIANLEFDKDVNSITINVGSILNQLSESEVVILNFRLVHGSAIDLSRDQLTEIRSRIVKIGEYTKLRIIYKNISPELNDKTYLYINFNNYSETKEVKLETRPIFVITKDTLLLEQLLSYNYFKSYKNTESAFENGRNVLNLSRALNENPISDKGQIKILLHILEDIANARDALKIKYLEENLRKLKNDNRWTLSLEGSVGYKADQISGLGLSGNTNISDYNVRLGVGKKLFSISEGRAGEFHLFVGGEFGQKNISETFKLENYHDAPKVDVFNDAYYNRLNGDNLKTSLHWNTVATSMGVNYNSQPILNSKFTWTASLICIYGSNAGLLKENLEGTIRINRIYPQISDEPLFDEYFQNTSMIPVNQYTNVRFSAYDYIAWEGGLGMNINLSPDVLLGFAVRNRFWQKQSFSAENTKGDYLPLILFNPSSGSNSFFWKFGIIKIL